MCVYICIYLYVCMYVYIYIIVYTHTHKITSAAQMRAPVCPNAHGLAVRGFRVEASGVQAFGFGVRGGFGATYMDPFEWAALGEVCPLNRMDRRSPRCSRLQRMIS